MGKKVKNLLGQLKIELYNLTLSYLQYGQAKATNKTIMDGIKKRLIFCGPIGPHHGKQ